MASKVPPHPPELPYAELGAEDVCIILAYLSGRISAAQAIRVLPIPSDYPASQMDYLADLVSASIACGVYVAGGEAVQA